MLLSHASGEFLMIIINNTKIKSGSKSPCDAYWISRKNQTCIKIKQGDILPQINGEDIVWTLHMHANNDNEDLSLQTMSN